MKNLIQAKRASRSAQSVKIWAVIFLLQLCFNAAVFSQELKPTASYENSASPVIEDFCTDCHSESFSEGNLSFDLLTDFKKFQENRKQWQRVLNRVRDRAMPPPGEEQPTDQERQEIIGWLSAKLAELDCSAPADPGHTVIRRLNQTEYRNTIYDLLHVRYDTSKVFATDQLGHGFDNIAAVHTLTPNQVENYLNAARQIVQRAILAPEAISKPVYNFDYQDFHWRHKPNKPLRNMNTSGVAVSKHKVSHPGTYILRLQAYGDQAGDEFVKAALWINKKRIKTFEIRTEAEDPETIQVVVSLTARTYTFGVEFLNDFYHRAKKQDRNFHPLQLELIGPLEKSPSQPTKFQTRLLSQVPSSEEWYGESSLWKKFARPTLKRFLYHAYRRPIKPRELIPFIKLMAQARDEGASYEAAVQLAIQATLASPQFLFRFEKPPTTKKQPLSQPSPAGMNISQYELATRLSYFLWSSTPDSKLLKQAKQGTLRKNLRQQIARMLKDSHAVALVDNFGQQWLETRKLEDLQVDSKTFPSFNDELRTSMQEETRLFLLEMLRQDKSILELLSADYTFLNERLAKHYGIKNVRGNHFRKVSLRGTHRGGVLTHASILTVTSNPNRTSPVKRGKWILSQLLNSEPPPPPANVSDLPDEKPGKELTGTMRERMKAHRDNPACYSCHVRMDPLGFSLDNYDAIGRWRDLENGKPINATGLLPDGREFHGADGLRKILLQDQDAFRRCMTEKMLTYALGRGLEHYDRCAVEIIVADLKANGDKISILIRGIIESVPFQQQRLTVLK